MATGYRKVIYSQMLSLDGYIEARDGNIDWSIPGAELFQHFLGEENTIDTYLYGRRTYENMAGYWQGADTNAASTESEVQYARTWQKTPKVVFSTTLEVAGENSRIVKEHIAEEVGRLKAQEGLSMSLGGAALAESFMQMDLIDEYHLYIHPVVLGGGKPFFPMQTSITNLKLLETKTFDISVVYLRYERT
ncbi:dihydrofolate reductase family protein [Virgibacillus oceani]